MVIKTMYTILVNKDDNLITTNREIIYHRSNKIQKIQFLVDPYWTKDGQVSDLRTFMCVMEYRTPASMKYTPVLLTCSEELYKERLEYLFDIDTSMTSEVGNVQIKLTWTKLEKNIDGTFNEKCRPTAHTNLEISSIAQWGDYVANSDLSNIAQIMLTNQANAEQLKIYAEQLTELGKALTVTKADNMTYNKKDNSIQLESMGSPIGDKVKLPECECDGVSGGGGVGDELNGIPTVDIDDIPETNEFDTVFF